jgi:hypothetical protein
LDWSESAANNPQLDEEQRANAKGQAALTREILNIIRDWKAKQSDDCKVDIEILLDTVEQ